MSRSGAWNSSVIPEARSSAGIDVAARSGYESAYEIGARMSLADMAWAHAEQTRIFRRFQTTFRDYDLVLSPTTPVSPFPWAQLYLDKLEGKKLRNYYHWMATKYFVTLTSNPSVSNSRSCGGWEFDQVATMEDPAHAIRSAGTTVSPPAKVNGVWPSPVVVDNTSFKRMLIASSRQVSPSTRRPAGSLAARSR